MHDDHPSGQAIKDRTLAMWREFGKDTTIEDAIIDRKFWEQISTIDGENR